MLLHRKPAPLDRPHARARSGRVQRVDSMAAVAMALLVATLAVFALVVFGAPL